MDQNSVRRKCKLLKYFIVSQGKIEKEIERIQKEIDLIEWTTETMEYRKRIYKELEKRIERFRMIRIRINWYKKDLLEKSNITG